MAGVLLRTAAMLPVITLNGAMCFLFAWILTASETARSHPAMMTTLAGLAWLGVYTVLGAKNIAFARCSTMTAFAAGCALASLAVTYWLWPACTTVPGAAVVRSGGLAGVMEAWLTILLFATSLAIFFGFAHRFQHAHAAIGRLAALPIVPLFGLYTAATVLEPDPAALGKLKAMRSMVLIGWMFAMLFVVAFSRHVMRSASAGSGTLARAIWLIAGWALSLGCIVASARLAACPGP